MVTGSCSSDRRMNRHALAIFVGKYRHVPVDDQCLLIHGSVCAPAHPQLITHRVCVGSLIYMTYFSTKKNKD